MRFNRSGKYTYALLACLTAFLLLLPSASCEQPHESARTQATLIVAFTGDVNGDIEPCG